MPSEVCAHIVIATELSTRVSSSTAIAYCSVLPPAPPNSSDLRQAGAVLAAEFLQEFAGEGLWAHADIAGPAFFERSRGDYLSQRGGTGYGVRLIVELASRLSE